MSQNKIKKIEISIQEEDYELLAKISKDKNQSIEELIQSDLKGLIQYFREQYKSIGLTL